jgi:hypothetical protein
MALTSRSVVKHQTQRKGLLLPLPPLFALLKAKEKAPGAQKTVGSGTAWPTWRRRVSRVQGSVGGGSPVQVLPQCCPLHKVHGCVSQVT